MKELPCTGGYRALYEVEPDTGANAAAGDIAIVRAYGPHQARVSFRTSRP